MPVPYSEDLILGRSRKVAGRLGGWEALRRAFQTSLSAHHFGERRHDLMIHPLELELCGRTWGAKGAREYRVPRVPTPSRVSKVALTSPTHHIWIPTLALGV